MSMLDLSAQNHILKKTKDIVKKKFLAAAGHCAVLDDKGGVLSHHQTLH